MFKKTKNSLAIALSMAMLATMITIPSVASAATSTPLEGVDRYQTAIKIAQKDWTTSENVIIARGDILADALSAAPLAYQKDKAPILLTKTNEIPAGVLEELVAMKVKKVYIVGGEGAVSKAVADKLDENFEIERIGGKNRVDTSYNIAQEAFTTAPKEAVIVDGNALIDALSISAVAAYKEMPILLVRNNKLSADVESYIAGKKVYAVGGTLNNAVTGNATRLEGNNRYDTNAAVLTAFEQDYSKIYLAKGTKENMVDALTGSALAAKGNNPIVLVDGKNAINDNQETVVAANITTSSAIFTLGGTVTDVAVDATPTETVSQKNAMLKAKSYLDHSAFSKTGLIKQLEFEGFNTKDATYGVDNCGADWMKQAVLKAKSYLDHSAFSRDALIKQLEFEGFTSAQAVFGVDSTGL